MIFDKIRKDDRDEFLAMEHDFYHSPAVLHPIPDANHELTFNVLTEGSPYAVCFIFRSDDKKGLRFCSACAYLFKRGRRYGGVA